MWEFWSRKLHVSPMNLCAYRLAQSLFSLAVEASLLGAFYIPAVNERHFERCDSYCGGESWYCILKYHIKEIQATWPGLWKPYGRHTDAWSARAVLACRKSLFKDPGVPPRSQRHKNSQISGKSASATCPVISARMLPVPREQVRAWMTQCEGTESTRNTRRLQVRQPRSHLFPVFLREEY